MRVIGLCYVIQQYITFSSVPSVFPDFP